MATLEEFVGNQRLSHGIATISSTVAPTSGGRGLGGEIGACSLGKERRTVTLPNLK
jgi:hypothetical protein